MRPKEARNAQSELASRWAVAYGDELIVRARFVAPRLRASLIARPQLEALLGRLTAYPLTLVRAEAGYGKTTAVAAFLAHAGLPYLWYNLADGEADPLIYLLHLIHLFQTQFPKVGRQALELLAQSPAADAGTRPWLPAVDALVNDLLDNLIEETVIVLEDYDSVQAPEINAITERLVEHAPPGLHLLITARSIPNLRARARWRASGELLEIRREQLAFTPDEVSALVEQRTGERLAPTLAQALIAETEGWPIALKMLSENLTGPGKVNHLLRQIPGSADLLFDYLAEEVFLRQPEAVRAFLTETAILRQLEPAACDYLRGSLDSAQVLAYLEAHAVFVVREGSYRYHRLFQDFLLRRAGVGADHWSALHARVAGWYRQRGDYEAAIHHLLAAGEYGSAADLVSTLARSLVHQGRHRTLAAWLTQLPPPLLEAHPDLMLALGHAQRYSSRFADALDVYERARRRFALLGDQVGETRALRGQALVYLDTVQPAQAEPLLRLALRKAERSDPETRVGLLVLLAENKLNAGDLRPAERLYRRLAGVTGQATVDSRLFVRDGRMALGRQLVEAALRAQTVDPTAWARAPRSHREAPVLLAWIDAMTGEADSARRYAEQSLEVGRTLEAPIIECISLARLGHGWLAGLDADPARARDFYRESRLIAERIGLPRFKVEALLGLALVAALNQKLAEAEACAAEALAILAAAGDRYLTALVQLGLGAAQVLCDHRSAGARLTEAARLAAQCGDRLAPCMAQLWLALHYDQLGRPSKAQAALKRALRAAEENGYDFVFTRVPLLGPKARVSRSALLRLLEQTAHGPRAVYAARLLRAIDHPAAGEPAAGRPDSPMPLYIQAFGRFRVWQNGHEVERPTWGREKALHLLQYLVCQYGRRVSREQIMAALWPETPSSAATTGLRVALNALRRALTGGDFIGREGGDLWLALSNGVRCDVLEFARILEAAQQTEPGDPEGAIRLYETALALYQGEFLADTAYADWAAPERERLQGEYVAAAERLARALLDRGQPHRAAEWAQAILARDPLWEEAYTLLMEAHWRQGHRALAVRTFERCRRQLAEALQVEPSPATQALYTQIVRG